MKKIILSILAAAAIASAQSESHTHDGFFFNLSMGFGYQSVDYAYDSKLYDENDNHVHEFNLSGTATDLDIKFGGRIANNLLLHVTLAGVTNLGRTEVGEDDDITANLSILGLGTTYYFLNNCFATASFGMSEFHIGSNIATFTASANNIGESLVSGLAIQVGAGKEWWVSDNWGLGVSLALLYGFDFGEYDYRDASTSVSIRFSATYN